MHLKTIPLLAALVPLSGCFLSRELVNEPIPSERVTATAQLKPGQSTQADVLALLGSPEEEVELYKRSAWLYRHTQSKRAYLWLGLVVLSNTDQQSDRVWCFFDENGTYLCSGASLRAESASYSMPWSDSHSNGQ